MKRAISFFCVMFVAVLMYGQRLSGIRFNSFDNPVVVYINGEKICTPTNNCVVVNLKMGYYNVEVFESRYGRLGEREWIGDMVLRDRIYFDGDGFLDIDIPAKPSRIRRPDRDGRYTRRGDAHFYDDVMSDEEFKRFMSSYDRIHFKSDRERFLRTIINTNSFIVDQVKIIIAKEAFDSDKVKLAKKLYPKIVDKKNAWQIVDVFSFESSKREFMKFIDSYRE